MRLESPAGETQVGQCGERLPQCRCFTWLLCVFTDRSILASGSLWDVIKVLGVAACDRSNVPRSLGHGDLGRHTAP